MTTGRSRRCGWFDAVIARYAVRVNGITDLFLTKLDVLSGLENVPICVGYEVDGQRVDEMPMTQADVTTAVPVYETMPGWFEDISACRSFADLPAKARDYVERIEQLSGAPVSAIGVGPGPRSLTGQATTRASSVALGSRDLGPGRRPVDSSGWEPANTC